MLFYRFYKQELLLHDIKYEHKMFVSDFISLRITRKVKAHEIQAKSVAA